MIIGRLTRDPELRTTPNGASVCQMGLATNYVYTSQQTNQKVEQVEFHNVVMWRRLAEIANQYLKKGRRVYVEGRLQTRSWEGKDGQKRSRTEIVADNMIMLDGGSGRAGNGDNPNTESSSNYQAGPMVEQQPSLGEELPTINQEESINVEDIPF